MSQVLNFKSFHILLTLIVIYLISIGLAYFENKLKYSEVWITDVPIVDLPQNAREEDKKGTSIKLEKELVGIKQNNLISKPWAYDRRYKSSLIYVKSENKDTIDVLYNLVTEKFQGPIVRVLPQEKINTFQIFISKTLCLSLLLIMGVYLTISKDSKKYLLSLITLVLATLSIFVYNIETRKWINQIEYKTQPLYSGKTLSYGQLQATTAVNTQVGELATRILESKAPNASFKTKSAHRIFNKKSNRADAYKLWVRSPLEENVITQAVQEAESIALDSRTKIKEIKKNSITNK